MAESKTIEILKRAILLEARGHSFYTTVSRHAENDAVKQFFQHMADEENQHIKFLKAQLESIKSGRKIESPGENNRSTTQDEASVVLDRKVKNRIHGAGFEAAAISAAMLMEERAINLYAERAKSTEDPDEKAIYLWLADWEKEHLKVLTEIDRELTENIWHDNSFWPF